MSNKTNENGSLNFLLEENMKSQTDFRNNK